MALSTSEIILKNMVRDSGYTSRVLPFLKPEYFERKEEKVLYNHIAGYIEKYKSNPTIEALYISLAEDKKINEKEADGIDSLIKTIKEDAEESKIDWLIDTTEKFCQERALHNAVYETIQIIEGETKLGKGAIPDILKEALAVSFDTSLGQDYFDDAEARYEYYHQKEVKFPFDIDYFNRATKDGFARKTLNLLLSGSGVGKTAVMVHMAASNIKLGQNVMYFTMEISEKEIFKRVDANLLDLTIDDVVTIPKEMYLNKINKLKLKTPGVLKVKEYPMGAAHVGHFRAHLNELKLKQN